MLSHVEWVRLQNLKISFNHREVQRAVFRLALKVLMTY